jgi:seryl-tRNA synthetase
MSVTTDQQLAGVIMKIGGSIYMWTIITVIFFRRFMAGWEQQQTFKRSARIPDAEIVGHAERPLVIDVRLLRSDRAGVLAALARRRQPELLVQAERAAELDAAAVRIARERDDLRRRVNDLSQQVGRARREGRGADADALTAESRALGEEESVLAAKATVAEGALRQLLLEIPNLPHPEVPDGEGEEDNPVVLGPVGLPDSYPEHQRVPHWEIGRQLGILDNERAVKISGAMFSMTRGLGATLGPTTCGASPPPRYR